MAGKDIEVKLAQPLGDFFTEAGDKQKKIRKVTGVLQGFEDGNIKIQPDDQTIVGEGGVLKIPMECVRNAQVVHDFNQGYHPKQ